jgi:hypothetical protein
MVGARGFEPPTPWSRTGVSENLKPCGCRTYKHRQPQNPASVGPQSAASVLWPHVDSTGALAQWVERGEVPDRMMGIALHEWRGGPHTTALSLPPGGCLQGRRQHG